MAQYKYTAIDPSGKSVSGALAAGDISEAGAALRKRGLAITLLGERESAEGNEPGMDLLTMLGRVGKSDVVLLFRQLASLLASGVTVVAALQVLEKQAEKRRLRYVLSNLRKGVEAGNPLSDAMAGFPRQFPIMITSIIRAGEMSGLLDDALDRIATQLEESAAFRTQVITGFIYPAVVMTATLAVSAFLVGYVIPRVVPFLKAGGARLPWNTKLLLDVSDFLQGNFAYIGYGVLGAVTLIFLFRRTDIGRYNVDLYKMRIPLIGPIFRLSAVVQFARTVGTLLASGIPVLESLKAARETVNNAAVRHTIDGMVARVTAGESLSVPIENATGVFPPMLAAVVRVGEETGNMDRALTLAADIHQKMLQTRIKRMNSIIEPALTVILAGLVAFVAWSLIAGMMSMYGK